MPRPIRSTAHADRFASGHALAWVALASLLALSGCVEGLGCASDAECPDGLICAESCVLPTTVDALPSPPATLLHVVVSDGGAHAVHVGADLGEVVAVSAPVGVDVEVDESEGGSVITVDSAFAIEADVAVTFAHNVVVEVALRPGDWQDPTRLRRRVLSLVGPAYAASRPGDLFWIAHRDVAAADARLYDPDGGALVVVDADDDGVTVARPRGDVVVVYSGVVEDSDDADGVVAPDDDGDDGDACAAVAVGERASIPGAGVIETLIKVPREAPAELELLAFDGSAEGADAFGGEVRFVLVGDVIKVRVTGPDDDGVRIDTDVGEVSGVVGDDAWHSLTLFYTDAGAALLVDERVSALPPLPPLSDVVGSAEVCALLICADGQALSPAARGLLSASRNGEVVRVAPQVVRQQAFADVAAIAGAVAVDASVGESVVIVAAHGAAGAIVTGLGLTFEPVTTSLPTTAVFVGRGSPNAQLPLQLAGGGAEANVVDVVVTQLRGAQDISAILAHDGAASAGAVVVGAPAGALLWVVAEGAGTLSASSPTVAAAAGALAVVTSTLIHPQATAQLRFNDGEQALPATTSAIVFVP